MVDWQESFEQLWEDFKDKIYTILFVTILILVPFILVTPGFQSIPIISNIFGLAQAIGLLKGNVYVLNILSLTCIWAIFAASWDLLSGYTGQVSFGHAVFWGLGAYMSVWMTVHFFSIDPVTGLFLGAIAAAFLAFIIGIIALRVKGPYLALITLMLPLIAKEITVINEDLGGYFPILLPDNALLLKPVGVTEVDALNFYIFAVLVMFICVSIIMGIAFSRYGLAFQSIREDEDAAESLGINLRFYKILAFTFSAFFAGIAGVLYSNWFTVVDKSMYDAQFSFTVIIMCVIGGIGTIKGGVIGAFTLTLLIEFFLKDVFHEVDGLEILAYGMLLILTLRFMKYGLSRAPRDEKKAVVIGILFAFSWIIVSHSNFQNMEILTLIGVIIMFIFSIPAIPVFLLSEAIGVAILTHGFGMTLGIFALVRAKFLIYCSIGIPFAYYLPKIFKKVRLRFWGVWPSAGRYEPD
ncbi:MAG: branched-chain amino acid ABC transporter permease [Candidatus Hodarchaeales archaeon]|jgi:branched-chain amino acid transport system permease protein